MFLQLLAVICFFFCAVCHASHALLLCPVKIFLSFSVPVNLHVGCWCLSECHSMLAELILFMSWCERVSEFFFKCFEIVRWIISTEYVCWFFFWTWVCLLNWLVYRLAKNCASYVLPCSWTSMCVLYNKLHIATSEMGLIWNGINSVGSLWGWGIV